MFKGISASKYTSLVRKLIDNKKFRAIEMRRTFSSKGYFIKTIKLWLYYWFIEQPKLNAKILATFGVKVCDSKLHLMLNTSTLALFSKYKRKGYKAKSVREFDAAIAYVVESSKCRSFVRKMVYRKMRFIFEQHGMDPDDICKLLIAGGIQAAMFTYPNITSMEHLCNIITRTAHNDGMNFIDKYTTKGRGRLRQNANQKFDSRVVVPLDSPEVMEYLGKVENALNQEDFETTKLSVRKVVSTYSKKQQYFLKLASGDYDKKFTEWLSTQGKSRKDNDILFERLAFVDYIKLTLEYLNVSLDKGLALIEEIKVRLKDHKMAA